MGNEKKNWKLVWSDEFDAPEINRDYWNFELGYVRNNELQKYVDTPENSYIEDGCLVIEAIKTDDPDCPYTASERTIPLTKITTWLLKPRNFT